MTTITKNIEITEDRRLVDLDWPGLRTMTF